VSGPSYVDHPLRLDAHGRTASTDEAGWVRDLVEHVLFTAPGERVHRPDFGSGLLQLTFAPDADELATTVQFLVQGTLQQELGHVLEIGEVTASGRDAELTVTVSFTVRRSGVQREERFVVEVPS
jgi:phage baseplate assembly protein W